MSTYYETWKCIGAAIGRSERWCRMMAHRQPDPLPVYKFCGTVRIDPEELEAWIGRQKSRTLTRPVSEALRLIA